MKKEKRYEDYDDLEMKKIIFKGKKFVLCSYSKCKKRIYKIEDGIFVYNKLYCKKCSKKVNKQASKEVDKMMKNAEKEGII